MELLEQLVHPQRFSMKEKDKILVITPTMLKKMLEPFIVSEDEEKPIQDICYFEMR